MKLLLLILFIFILQLRAFSQLPACKDSLPTSLLPNNSFEEYPGCTTDHAGLGEGGPLGSTTDKYEIPGWQAVWTNSGVNYHNYNCKLNTTASIFDSTIFCHSFVTVS